MTAGERQPLTAEQHAQTIRAALNHVAAWRVRDGALESVAALLARAESAEAALADLDAATRKPNGVITNEWYFGAVSTVQAIVRAALAGSSPAAEAETRCTDPLGDAITVLEHVEIVDASSRPDTEQAQQRVNLALSYLRMLPQRDPRTMAQIVADADLREAGGVSDSSEARESA